MRPLWEKQDDMWGPGGAASEVQIAFDERYRELDLLQRAIEVEQRELEVAWQTVWDNGGTGDAEFQALEDLRYEKQRELDRIYRFGYRPVEDIWDEINELNSTQGWANTDSQIESEQINIELRRLWDLQMEIQNAENEVANQINNEIAVYNDQLNNLNNFGWDPIYELHSEIDRLEGELVSSIASSNSDGISAQIADLKNLRDSYVINRDAEIAAYKATLAALDDGTTEAAPAPVATSVEPSDSSERIAVLTQLIAGLQIEAAALTGSKNAEIDALNVQVADKTASYDALIATARSDSQTLSDSLSTQIADLSTQITDLTTADAEANADQIADLQAQHDAALAQQQAESGALESLIAGYEADRDAENAELQLSITAIQASISSELTASIDAQIAEHNAELASLQAVSTDIVDIPVVTVSNTQSADDILASIESSENYWNGLIADIEFEINDLQSQSSESSSATDNTNSRIDSLRLQVAEQEQALYDESSRLEALINDAYQQSNNSTGNGSGQLVEVQRQIDDYNAKLEAIWQQDSSDGLNVLKRVQELEKQARVLEDDNKQVTDLLEEELWDLDDKLSLFHKDQNSGSSARQIELEAEATALQQRRFDIEEQRWAIEQEQQLAFKTIETEVRESEAEMKQIEKETFGVIREQMRELALELRVFRAQERDIEKAMREAGKIIDTKKRELEDEILDALEQAAGVADDLGAIRDIEEFGEFIPESIEGDVFANNDEPFSGSEEFVPENFEDNIFDNIDEPLPESGDGTDPVDEVEPLIETAN
jgi:hypothetical protein